MGRGRKFLPSGKRVMSRLLPHLFTVPRPNSFNVPKNEAEVIDLSPTSNTPEWQLKSFLLSTDEETKVCAAVGMGGVGKSTGLRALGHDSQIWMGFRDGIWFIQLGQDATLDDFFADLSRLVAEACSAEFVTRFATLLAEKGGDVAAAGAFVKELEKLRFLLIFDDIWEENEVYRIVRRIGNTVSASSGCLKMVISTRRKEVAHCPLTNKMVDFHPKQYQDARRILCVHARISLESLLHLSTIKRKAVEDILERCAGLPLALAVAGSAVHIYMRGADEEEDRDHSWLMLRDSLSTSAVRLGQKGSNEHEEGLFACIDASMRHVENKWSFYKSETVDALLSSLCIFPKQAWIPLETLQRMWRMGSERAESFIEMLSDYSIISHVGRKGKHGVRAHDLVLDYCGELARKDATTMELHKRLVEGYIRDLDPVKGEEVPCLNWWSEKLSADLYIRANVVRHLVKCGMIDEAVRLICDYRWVQQVNNEESRHPFQQCISDLKRAKQSISAYLGVGSKVEHGLGLLAETMELCVVACARNRSECTFQLYGRLSSLFMVSAPELFSRCLWSIETFATRPWVKAAPGALRAAGGNLKNTVPVPFRVHRMEVGMEGDELVLGGGGGEVAVVGLRDGVLRWCTEGHAGKVTGLEIDPRNGEVFASWAGTVGVWREGTPVRQFRPFRLYAGELVTCMKLLFPHKLIACGTNKGKLILMDMTTGHIVRKMNYHKALIASIVVGDDGELLISASYDRTVQKWNTKSGQPIGEPLCGHTAGVECAALSAAGHLIASGSRDNTVRLWDTQAGVEVCAALRRHSTAVQSVLFSRKDDILFSGSMDSILVWDVRAPQSGVSMKHEISYDMGCVTSLRLSRDGEELFAASEWKSEVYVWIADVQQAFPNSSASDRSFASDIIVFGISPNGEVMATCSRISKDTIDIRRTFEVYGGIDNVLYSCPTIADSVGPVAVSNDMKLVAYCKRSRGTTLYVAKASTGEVELKLTELSDWISSLGPYHLAHISAVLFDSEGISIVAEIHAHQLFTNKRVSTSVEWSTSTGQAYPVECTTSTNTVETDTSRQNLPPKTVAPHLWMKKFDSYATPFGNELLFSDESGTLTVGTLDEAPRFSHYDNRARRMWISSPKKGLQFFDLIIDPIADLPTKPPSMPLITRSSSSQNRNGTSGSFHPQPSTKYIVFISYSGPDKPLADWLRKTLIAMGISCFAAKNEIKVGDIASEVMIQAMENASVAIILVSREYPAKKWTMKELLCFQRRRQEAREKGEVGPIIIPLFFRMSVRECKNPAILEMKTEDGMEYVFHKYGFFDRLDEVSVEDMKVALRKLGGIQGIENRAGVSYKPQPGQSKVEWQKELDELLEQVVEAVVDAVRKPGERFAHGSGTIGPIYSGDGVAGRRALV